MADNLLYYGDNLDILRRYIADESLDLVYLDPPFNSDANYNVLFAEQNGSRSAAQIQAFTDTWQWDQAAAAAYQAIVEAGPDRVSRTMQAFRSLLGPSDMLAYLAMMAPRLVELHRVLKPTGSLYLHCDSTASHYLKLLLDGVFGPKRFTNEVIWKRTNARSTASRWPRVHDTLLLYAKSATFTFHRTTVPGDIARIPHTLVTAPDGRKYQTFELTAAGVTKEGDSGKPWRGFDPTTLGRHWANSLEQREAWDADGLIHWASGGGWPRRRADEPFDPEARMVTVGDVWTDIDRINQSAAERLGYPTQKPEALLERIISASSDPGNTVLDPFCGCGTTIAAAQKLARRWIGIDVTHLAITLIKHRLTHMFADDVHYEVLGEPLDESGALALAEQDRFQFQWWALGLVGARPVEQKKGADQGIDGRIYFHDEAGQGCSKQILLSVKSGSVSVRDMRDLRAVVERENAQIGVLITLQAPKTTMVREAAAAGMYRAPAWNKDYPRLQILSIAQLLAGRKIQCPPLPYVDTTFKRARRVEAKRKGIQGEFFEP